MEPTYRRRIQEGKKGIFSIIFSRKVIMIFLVLLQVFGLYIVFSWLSQFVAYVYGAFLFLQLVITIVIINDRDDAAFKISWLVTIMSLPVVGMLFYFLSRARPGAAGSRNASGRTYCLRRNISYRILLWKRRSFPMSR